MAGIAENIRQVREQVNMAAARAQRSPAEIGIVAVTKTVPSDLIQEAVDAGLTVLGENRVQELTAKHPALSGVDWHLIGHLQSNKVKYIVDKVSMIHSLDSLSLAQELNRRMADAGRVMEVLIQVNVAEETSKYGIRPEDTIGFAREVSTMPGLRIMGLMTIGPYVADPEEIRPVFKKLRLLAQEVKTIDIPGVEMKHLSMGMSNDYIVAVEEGATLIRLGSVIFGQRT